MSRPKQPVDFSRLDAEIARTKRVARMSDEDIERELWVHRRAEDLPVQPEPSWVLVTFGDIGLPLAFGLFCVGIVIGALL